MMPPAMEHTNYWLTSYQQYKQISGFIWSAMKWRWLPCRTSIKPFVSIVIKMILLFWLMEMTNCLWGIAWRCLTLSINPKKWMLPTPIISNYIGIQMMSSMDGLQHTAKNKSNKMLIETYLKKFLIWDRSKCHSIFK